MSTQTSLYQPLSEVTIEDGLVYSVGWGHPGTEQLAAEYGTAQCVFGQWYKQLNNRITKEIRRAAPSHVYIEVPHDP